MRKRYIDELRVLMSLQNPVMEYQGLLSQEVLLKILSELERLMNNFGERTKISRKNFNIVTECLQNVIKYGNTFSSYPEGMPAFIMDRQKNHYVIGSGNLMHYKKVRLVKEKLNYINRLDQPQIQLLYKQVIRENLHKVKKNKNSAGLGLIEMARKSKNSFIYDFKPFNNNYVYFLLVIQVNRN